MKNYLEFINEEQKAISTSQNVGVAKIDKPAQNISTSEEEIETEVLNHFDIISEIAKCVNLVSNQIKEKIQKTKPVEQKPEETIKEPEQKLINQPNISTTSTIKPVYK